ncbi:hypothetical protein [Nocardia tengchongensis]|uniref:hypothetical protein n=1 Tax=Nocardia tengchongensis TaxID=2055889 RepID=UPI00364A1595
MSVTPPEVKSQPSEPDPSRMPPIQALVALALAVSLSTTAGLLWGWEAAFTVLIEVLELFTAYGKKS